MRRGTPEAVLALTSGKHGGLEALQAEEPVSRLGLMFVSLSRSSRPARPISHSMAKLVIKVLQFDG